MENITTTSLDYTELAEVTMPIDDINTTFINNNISLVGILADTILLSSVNTVNMTE